MSQPDPNSQPIRPEDALPPVEPPSAGFIVQLFVIPGVIVTIIVMTWLAFTWLAQKGSDPKQYIEGLLRSGPNRWQMASNLANALRDPRNVEFKRDHQSAQRLATILKDEIEKGGMDQMPVTLRVFLCRALGEFQVGDGIDALLLAATTERDLAEIDVRRSAVEGIALLAANMPQNEPPQQLKHPKLEPTLIALSGDSNELVRSSTAFALGVIATPAMLGELEKMLNDLHPDVRYNAATGLARHGNEAAIPALQEMLDLEEDVGVNLEQQKNMRESKRALLVVNALRAARQLAEANPAADLSPLVASVQKLIDSDLDLRIQKDARETAIELGSEPAAPSAE